jgi:hypothetical protein
MAAPDPLPGPRRALVIGTAIYDDAGLAQLRAPAQDVADVTTVLADQAIGGFEVTSVVDQQEHLVRRAIGEFLAGCGIDDFALVYLSCHGVLDGAGRLYFAAKDTVRATVSWTGLLESSWLLKVLEDCRARRQVVILDCCFAGSFANVKGCSDIDLEHRFAGSGRGRIVLTASQDGEYSFEGDPLPGATVSRSLFTAGLLDGLRTGNADRDGDGYISVDDAFDHAVDHIKAAGGVQRPQRWVYRGEGNLILARSPRGALVRLAALPESLQLSLDNPYPDVRKGAVAELGGWLTSDEPGRVLAARQALERVAAQDSPAVAEAARAHLKALGDVPADDGGQHDQGRHRTPSLPRLAVASGTGPRPAPLGNWRLKTTIRTSTNWVFKGVFGVAFGPDGSLLATASEDNTVRLWAPLTGTPVGSPLRRHANTVRAVAFSPNGRLLASAAAEKTVLLWDIGIAAGVRLLAVDSLRTMSTPLRGHTGWQWAVAFSSDGQLLASAGEDKTVRLWDPETGSAVGEPLRGHDHSVMAACFSPHGQLLATADNGGAVRLWDASNGAPIRQPLKAHQGDVRSLAFSPDGSVLAAASKTGAIQLWDPAKGWPAAQSVAGHTKAVLAVAFSPDGLLLASGSADKTVRLWNPVTGVQIGHALTGHTKAVLAIAFSPDGRLLASGSADGTVRVWSRTGGEGD